MLTKKELSQVLNVLGIEVTGSKAVLEKALVENLDWNQSFIAYLSSRGRNSQGGEREGEERGKKKKLRRRREPSQTRRK